MSRSRYSLLSVLEASEQLGRKRWFVYDEISRKRLPYYRIGGHIAISQRDLDDYVERSRVPALGEKRSLAKTLEVAQ